MKTGSPDPDPKKMDRIRNTGLEVGQKVERVELATFSYKVYVGKNVERIYEVEVYGAVYRVYIVYRTKCNEKSSFNVKQ